MPDFFFDLTDSQLCMQVTDNMAMDMQGDMLLRIGDGMAMDTSGRVHFVPEWKEKEEK